MIMEMGLVLGGGMVLEFEELVREGLGGRRLEFCRLFF